MASALAQASAQSYTKGLFMTQTQPALLEELLAKVKVHSTTGLYDTHLPRDVRIGMFADYVRRLGNLFKRRKRSLVYIEASEKIDQIIERSSYEGVWLCRELMGDERWESCTNSFAKARYVKSLITSYNLQTSDDKAGPVYTRYLSIKESKDTELMKGMLLDSLKLEQVKSGLKRKYNDEQVLEKKLNEVLDKQREKVERIKFLEQVKEVRMKELEFAMKHDERYRRWARIKSIWRNCGFDKIQEAILQADVVVCDKNKTNGTAFEVGVIAWIKEAMIERFRARGDHLSMLTEKDLDIVTNVEICAPKLYTGEIDIVVINNITTEVLALIEIKRNVHDIGFGREQLNAVVKIFTENPHRCRIRVKNDSQNDSQNQAVSKDVTNEVECTEHRSKRFKTGDEFKKTKLVEENSGSPIDSLPYKLTPTTELLIVTKIPTDEDNTGASLPVIRAVSDYIVDCPMLLKIIESDTKEFDRIILSDSDKDLLWSIMMNVVKEVPGYTGIEHMVRGMNNNLLVYPNNRNL